MVDVISKRDKLSNAINSDTNSHGSVKPSPAHLREVAAVSICLTKQHEECDGGYNDFSDNYFIKCNCRCHRLSYEKDQRQKALLCKSDKNTVMLDNSRFEEITH